MKKGQKVRVKAGSYIRDSKIGYANPYQINRSRTVDVFAICEPISVTVGVKFSNGTVKEGFEFFPEVRANFNKWLEENGLILLEEALEKHPDSFLLIEANDSKIEYVQWKTEPERVEWIGSGGYYYQTNIKNVEEI